MPERHAVGWEIVREELSRWETPATLWWRDDDAVQATHELERLVALSRQGQIPMALAVIPLDARESLVEFLHPHANLSVLQHGYAHANRAPAGEKKAELGAHRPALEVLSELTAGSRQLRCLGLLGESERPVLVPPWNRIGSEVVAGLPGAGFRGLSTYGVRPGVVAAPGLHQVNTHVDIIDWRGSRGFVGEEVALRLLLDHLVARRTGETDPHEPTGILTHHLEHDEASWVFCERLLAFTNDLPQVRWCAAEALFTVNGF